MDADRGGRARKLFHRSEFSKLLILGVIAAIGWPLVLYYGKPRPEPPPPPRAAQIEALPQPDKAPEFIPVIDITPFTFRDTAARDLLLERVRTTSPAKLAAASRTDVTPLDLLKRPARHRGLPIELDGNLSQLFVLHDEPKEAAPSGRLYEAWITTPDQRLYPCMALLDEVPPTLPAGTRLSERVVFDGYFLKLLAYEAADKKRFAPLLVGRLRHYPEAKRESSWTLRLLPVGLLIGYLAIRLIFSLQKTLATTRKSPLLKNLPSDRLDPDQFEQWLAETSEGEAPADHDTPSPEK